jgi:hypothetical protein
MATWKVTPLKDPFVRLFHSPGADGGSVRPRLAVKFWSGVVTKSNAIG